MTKETEILDSAGQGSVFELVEALPDRMHPPEAPELVFQQMAGATIVRIGTPVSLQLEGGGLVIEYRPHADGKLKRLVLGLNGLGMWIEALCDVER